jgi:16S rRNA (cytosine967-C5)-methyltransferase
VKYFHSRFNTSAHILASYQYPQPFHLHLKTCFKGNKKFGSKDRKAIQNLCYAYFRTGLLFTQHNLKQRLLLSAVLLEWEDVEAWNSMAEDIDCDATLVLEDVKDHKSKLAFIQKHSSSLIQPFYPKDKLMDDFKNLNHLEHIVFRPKNWLKDHASTEPGQNNLIGCRELEATTELSKLDQVQDLSSQMVCNEVLIKDQDKVWDVCCGAGGKSLNLLSQRKGNFYLSDVRESILKNAANRMRQFDYNVKLGCLDLNTTQDKLQFENQTIAQPFFDKIVADVPCSGSGTWFRNPEHFSLFSYNSLKAYEARQKNIVSNAFKYLKSGGEFIYITCSVFIEENEVVRDWILANLPCQVSQEMKINGVNNNSDSMYMARFVKN